MNICSWCSSTEVYDLGYCETCYISIEECCIVLDEAIEPDMNLEELEERVFDLENDEAVREAVDED